MELWIRSQDKRHLLKVDNIDWFGGELYTNNRVSLETTKDGKTYLLGTYHNGKRALEVFDEIQNILSCKCLLKSYDNLTPEFSDNVIIQPCEVHIEQLNNYVYEMPKE